MKQLTDICGCCEGVEKLTPLPTFNRPGLNALRYRIGTHADFIETMLARLSSLYLEVPISELDEQGKPKTSRIYPLQGLKTRLLEDPSISLLDAWATVADVLTFYQERIANEGYLRTATERRSVLELARLVGYKLRPGVSASVFLAYTLDENFKDEVVIPKAARAQSVPGPGELPQSFETSEDLKAQATWNNLKPRQTQPQTVESILQSNPRRLYLKGISTGLKANDPLLIDWDPVDPDPENRRLYRVITVEPDAPGDRTRVELQLWITDVLKRTVESETPSILSYAERLKLLDTKPSQPLANALRLPKDLKQSFSAISDAGLQVIGAARPELKTVLPTALSSYTKAAPEVGFVVYALRQKAALFGHNFPKRQRVVRSSGNDLATEIEVIGEWPIVVNGKRPSPTESERVIFLDASYEGIGPDSWLVLDFQGVPQYSDEEEPHQVKPAPFPKDKFLITHATDVQAKLSRAEYGGSGDTTRVGLEDPWIKIEVSEGMGSQDVIDRDFQVIRNTVVYAQSEALELAEEPIEESVCVRDASSDLLELDGLYAALEPGRFLIVSGERADIPETTGVMASEAVMVTEVLHDVRDIQEPVPAGTVQGDYAALPGDRTHTFVRLYRPLSYCYKRDKVKIYSNVVKATHGETRQEVLGSGDGAKALQSFVLKQAPLTFVSAANPSGVDSTLKVTVNDVVWHEEDSLAGLSPTDRNFTTKTDDEGKTTVIFGNGREGARLPSGIENIKAGYRNGIGKPGNVKAGQISLLATRPLGVKDVINPLRASGGADKESRDQARKNAPLAVKALDRLVSVQDYEDFARTYAGVGKAYARELSDGHRQLVHVTIAGVNDIPIDETSDLFINLRRTLRDFGDPFQPIFLAVRELVLIALSARVRLQPDYQWEPVVTQLRERLLDAFSFERRELGQDVLLSEVLSVMQGVRGVAYVDVDLLRGIPEKIPDPEVPGQRRLLTPDEIADRVTGPLRDESGNIIKDIKEPLSRIRVNLADYESGIIRPAQLAFLTPDVPSTLILNQII